MGRLRDNLSKEELEAISTWSPGMQELFYQGLEPQFDDEDEMDAGGLIPNECDCCRRKKLREELVSIVNSPETRKRGEELHKQLSKMTLKDLLKVIH